MPLAGWFLIQDKGLSAWHTLWAGFYGALGCTIGSVITYWVGALGGRPILEKYGKAWMRPFDIPIALVLLVLAGWYVYRHIKRNLEHEARMVEEMAE